MTMLPAWPGNKVQAFCCELVACSEALQLGVSGDMDGDESCSTTLPELVEFLHFTKPWVDRRNWKDLRLPAVS